MLREESHYKKILLPKIACSISKKRGAGPLASSKDPCFLLENMIYEKTLDSTQFILPLTAARHTSPSLPEQAVSCVSPYT